MLTSKVLVHGLLINKTTYMKMENNLSKNGTRTKACHQICFFDGNSSKTQYSIRCVFNTKLNDLEIVLSTEFCEFSPESRYGT